MTYLLSICAIALSTTAVVLLWISWRDRRRPALYGSLAAWSAAIASWIGAFGAEIGIPLSLECAAIVAFLFILSRAERRPSRRPRGREAPPVVPQRGRWRRGGIRLFGAGPLGFAAATGAGLIFATNAPLADSTRLIVAGLLIPSFWAMAMIWVLASRRPSRPATGLLALSIATIGLSVLLAK